MGRKGPSSSSLRDEIDWTKVVKINHIRNQQQNQTGYCFFHASGAVLEYMEAIETDGRRCLHLADQQTIDCFWKTIGPAGITVKEGLRFWEMFPYVTVQGNYPPNGGQGNSGEGIYEQRRLRIHESRPSVGVGGWRKIQSSKDKSMEEAMKDALRIRPILGFVHAHNNFSTFRGGRVFQDHVDGNVNHAVAIVGYGTTQQGEDFWILQNSYGRRWGEGGLMRIARGVNMCGIENGAFLPLPMSDPEVDPVLKLRIGLTCVSLKEERGTGKKRNGHRGGKGKKFKTY